MRSKIEISIDDVPHVNLSGDYLGMQSYIDKKWWYLFIYGQTRLYCIEYYFAGHNPVLTEYVNKDLWIKIINNLTK